MCADAYGRGCVHYESYWYDCGGYDYNSPMPSEDACCACGGGDLCETSIGGVGANTNGQGGKCGCNGACTNSLDVSSSSEQIKASFNTNEAICPDCDGHWDTEPIYWWSDCFWVIKTKGLNTWVDINITHMPDNHFLEVSTCGSKKCCFPGMMGQTEEGRAMVLRMSNPPAFLRLDLKTYEDVEDDYSEQVSMQISTHDTMPEAVCGDGLPSPGEGCEDGNTKNGDGCSSDCTMEDNWMCTGDLNVEVIFETANDQTQTGTVRGGPMVCKEMCTTNDPCADCTSFDSGFGTCAQYAQDAEDSLYAFCKDDSDEFGIFAADACPVSCATTFILLCNSNQDALAFHTIETKTGITAASTSIEAGAFPDGSALKLVRHKFPSTISRSDRQYKLESLEDVWKDSVIALEMGAPALPTNDKAQTWTNRNAGIEKTVLNHDITGNTYLVNNETSGQRKATIAMAVDPCKLRTAAGCARVSGNTLKLCAPGHAALFSYDEAMSTWVTDGSVSSQVGTASEMTVNTSVTGKVNASVFADPTFKALDAAGSACFSPSSPSPALL